MLYNKKTGMPYVGRTASFGQRRAAHFSKSRNSSNEKLEAAIARYGKKAFVFRCIETHHQGTLSDAEFEHFIWQREVKWYKRILFAKGGNKALIYNAKTPARMNPNNKGYTAVRQWLSATKCVDYPSENFAAKKTGVAQSNISDCANHKSRTAGGFPWEKIPEVEAACAYDEARHPFSAIKSRGYYRPTSAEIPTHLRSIKRSSVPRTSKRPHLSQDWLEPFGAENLCVRQWISIKPRKFFDYPSMSYAARITGINQGSISKCCAFKAVHAGGCWWEKRPKMDPKHEFKEGITDPTLVRAQKLPRIKQNLTHKDDAPFADEVSLSGRSTPAQPNKPHRFL